MQNDFEKFSQTHLQNWLVKKHNPLFIHINSNGILENFHGKATDYGFNIKKESAANDCLPFLDGLLPFQSNELNLDCIQTPNGQYASVNVTPYLSGYSIFIYNVSKQALEIQEIQQNRNELCLAMNKIKDLLFELNY